MGKRYCDRCLFPFLDLEKPIQAAESERIFNLRRIMPCRPVKPFQITGQNTDTRCQLTLYLLCPAACEIVFYETQAVPSRFQSANRFSGNQTAQGI